MTVDPPTVVEVLLPAGKYREYRDPRAKVYVRRVSAGAYVAFPALEATSTQVVPAPAVFVRLRVILVPALVPVRVQVPVEAALSTDMVTFAPGDHIETSGGLLRDSAETVKELPLMFE